MLVNGQSAQIEIVSRYFQHRAIKKVVLPETCRANQVTGVNGEEKLTIYHDTYCICKMKSGYMVLSIGRINESNSNSKCELAFVWICIDINGLNDYQITKKVCSAIKSDRAETYRLLLIAKCDGTLVYNEPFKGKIVQANENKANCQKK